MKIRTIFVSIFLGPILTAQVTPSQDVPLKNWPAPLYWQPSPAETEHAGGKAQAEIRTPSPESTSPLNSLVFVAMTPCRVVDTRASQNLPAPFGPPSLVGGGFTTTGGPTRTFAIQDSTTCSIPFTARAYSFNVTVIPPGTLGFLTIWPTGLSRPSAVTLDDVQGQILNNAAIVPAGIAASGGVDVFASNNTDLVLDINGYYVPASGITLAQGTAAAPSLSFAGDATTGIFSSGTGTLSFTTAGTNRLTIRSDGDLELGGGSIRKGGSLFLHARGAVNTGVGEGAISELSTGTQNTAIGYATLNNNTTGNNNTASGYQALYSNMTGSGNTASGLWALLNNLDGGFNTATGFFALSQNNNGSFNTATGINALVDNTTGSFNTASGGAALGSNTSGSYNTAVGHQALVNTTGGDNTAIGAKALFSNTAGHDNTAVGINAGYYITGSDNIDIGNDGHTISGESGVIRIGQSPYHNSFFVAGVSGASIGSGVTVFVDSNGQLGTINSSRRFKEDIQDMSDASSGLLRLRPVTYRYQKPYADGSKPLDYGLIAEEVAEVYPDLVAKGADGQIETVQYHKLTPMLLNEVQKLQAQVTSLQKTLDTLLADRTQK